MISTPHPTARSVVVLAFIWAITSLLCGAPRTTYAASKVYVGNDNSSWNTAGNWSPSGVPAAGDDATLGTSQENATSNLDVTFNGNYPSSGLNSLTLNSSGLPEYMIFNQTMSGTYMTATTENIGTSSPENTYNQSAGTNNAGALNIGVNSSSNSYNLSGSGVLDVFGTVSLNGDTSSLMVVGVSGTGVMNQSGGIVDVDYQQPYLYNTAQLILGQFSGSNGTYNLSGGTLYADNEYIGSHGTGVFNQTGGTNNGGLLFVGGGNSGGTGTYNLSGGTLGNNSSNPFPVVISTGGTFNLLSGGTVASATLDVQAGTFQFGGGSFASPYGVTQEGGTIQLNGYSTTLNGLSQTGGSISNGPAGNSTLTIANANFLASAGPFQGSGGAISNGGSGKLSIDFTGTGTEVLAGTNTYTGATTISGGLVQAGSNTGFSSGSAFVLSGYGTLDANSYSVTVASLAGGASSAVSIGGGSLTAGADNTSTTFSGGLIGTGGFYKTGSGTLTLSGGGTFSGSIIVQGGTLAIGAPYGLPTSSSVLLRNGTSLNVPMSQTFGALDSMSLGTVNLTNTPTLTVDGNSGIDSMGTGFTGSGTLVKTGTGTLTLGYGSTDTAGANQDTGLTITVNQGQLTLNKLAGTNAVAGPLNINGGSVVLAASNQIADTSVVTLGGTFNLAGFNETIGGLSGGGTMTLGGGTLTVAQSGTSTSSGNLVGPGAFVMSGTGTLTLTSSGLFSGTYTVNSGQLTLEGTVNATSFTANSGGTLQFTPQFSGTTVSGTSFTANSGGTVSFGAVPVSGTSFTANSGGTLSFSGTTLNLNAGSLLANAGGTVQYNNATVSNGYLRGSGTQSLLSGSTNTFNGVTTYNSTVIAQNGPAFFNNFTNGGTINNGAALTFNGGTNASTGTINVSNTFNTQDFGTNGVMTIANGGTVSNSGSNFVAGGGSRTTISSGGTLGTASGTSLELNGALLTNNGTQNGLLDVNYGSSARGTGVFGTVNVTTGGKFGNNGAGTGGGGSTDAVAAALRLAPSLRATPTPFVGPQLSTAPGTITVGGMLLGPGSNLGINVQNATGAAGTGYDTFHDLGALTLSGNSTPGNQITISLASLNANGNPGAAANFNPAQAAVFTLVTADGGITGFGAGEFAVDTSGFVNALGGGSFTVGESGNNLLQLDFVPAGVPEPSTWLAGALLGAVGIARWKRKAGKC